MPAPGGWRRSSIATAKAPYPPIADYGLISDCHSTALISRTASIDWCCMPRTDSPSVFGRLLDWDHGGFCAVVPQGRRFATTRAYIRDTMVLRTTFASRSGEAAVIDCFTMRQGGRLAPHRQLLRVIEGVRGTVELKLLVRPRFDYGEVKPWIQHRAPGIAAAIGGSQSLLVSCDAELMGGSDHDLVSEFTVQADERVHLSLEWFPPESLEHEGPDRVTPASYDERLQETVEWWQNWAGRGGISGPDASAVRRSALVLRALVNAPTGAIAAAPTTSLPESPGGERNWDYRFSWIRDSSFSVRSLADAGYDREADGFRRFIQRSAAGSAKDLQIMYGLGGERRLTEIQIALLEGYRGAQPVRVGNAAAKQLQLDAYGELMLLTWRWHRRGQTPDDDYWRFLVDLVDTAIERWEEPDRGLWEIRGDPLHFVHSKALCWVAVDRGLALAADMGRPAPVTRWRRAARRMREAIETHGYDPDRGVFIQAFGKPEMDAALLLLPDAGFVDWKDPRMLRTVEEIRHELLVDGLLLRYRTERTDDGLSGQEGTFLPCTFWLAEALAWQGRIEEAREAFDRVASTGNDLGLFAEEFDTRAGEMLGNFPQGLTHYSHIAAALALAGSEPVFPETRANRAG
ncbi:MAG TPA: glycoside hydrolase family 15 protein [Candidatus Dormibacteraeota bacterium]